MILELRKSQPSNHRFLKIPNTKSHQFTLLCALKMMKALFHQKLRPMINTAIFSKSIKLKTIVFGSWRRKEPSKEKLSNVLARLTSLNKKKE